METEDEKPTEQEQMDEYFRLAGYLLETAKQSMVMAQRAIDKLEKHLSQR